jgi:hypothetical protein
MGSCEIYMIAMHEQQFAWPPLGYPPGNGGLLLVEAGANLIGWVGSQSGE